MGDITKRNRVLKFLVISAVIGISVAAASSLLQSQLNVNDPLKNCINERNTPFKIKVTLELYVDNQKADIPANIGFVEGGCQKSLYTLSDDGTIYAEWEEEFPFEIGHFLWIWDFPLRDMDQPKSKMFVNGAFTDDFIHAPLVEGYHYRAEFTSKAYEESVDKDFLPPDL